MFDNGLHSCYIHNMSRAKGFHHSEDTKRRISQATKGKRRPGSHRKYMCLNCQLEFEDLASTCRKYCSLKCYRAAKNGSTSKACQQRPGYLKYAGYEWIRVPPDFHGGDKRGVYGGKYYPKHRYVVEEILGRHLEKHETVHHINFDRLDNRPENLLVVSNSDHKKLETEMARRYMTEVVKSKTHLLELCPWLTEVVS